jgi:hypothetical protein
LHKFGCATCVAQAFLCKSLRNQYGTTTRHL